MARFWGSTLWVAGAADVFTAGKTSQAEVHRTDGGSKEEAKRGRSTRSRLERWVRGEGSAAWHLIWFCQLTHMQVHERFHQEVRSWQEGNRQWPPASAAFPRPGWSQRTRGGEWEAWPSAELWGKPCSQQSWEVESPAAGPHSPPRCPRHLREEGRCQGKV